MGNMSYCRFENTANDLRDCLDAIENNEHHHLSTYEVQGLEDIIQCAQEIVNMREELEEHIDFRRLHFNKID